MRHLRVVVIYIVAGLLLATAGGGCSAAGEREEMSRPEKLQEDDRVVSDAPDAPDAGDVAEATTKPAGAERVTATFGAGCFWGVEKVFGRVKGVVSTEVGYSGGDVKDPTYRNVCSGRTGHAEAVRVVFDPAVVSYEDLLDVFWIRHDPTTLNRQGPDVGTQYRSAIFTHSPAQQAAAETSRDGQQMSGRYLRKIVTEIVPAGPFYRAEEYHQKYLAKQGGAPAR